MYFCFLLKNRSTSVHLLPTRESSEVKFFSPMTPGVYWSLERRMSSIPEIWTLVKLADFHHSFSLITAFLTRCYASTRFILMSHFIPWI